MPTTHGAIALWILIVTLFLIKQSPIISPGVLRPPSVAKPIAKASVPGPTTSLSERLTKTRGARTSLLRQGSSDPQRVDGAGKSVHPNRGVTELPKASSRSTSATPNNEVARIPKSFKGTSRPDSVSPGNTPNCMRRFKSWIQKIFKSMGQNFNKFWSKFGNEVRGRPTYTCFRATGFLAWVAMFLVVIPVFCL